MENHLQSRIIALDILNAVLWQQQNLDDVFDKKASELDGRDKSFVRMLVTTCLRRMGQIDAVLSQLIEKPLPAKAARVKHILRLGVCQILFMETAEHAAVSTAVELAKIEKLDFYTKLINGVLRTVCRQKETLLNAQDVERLNTPDWLWDCWVAAYGEEKTRQIAAAHLTEAPTFISVKKDPDFWAQRLNGQVTDMGSVMLCESAYIPDLDGFKAGNWWVQDAAAAMPTLLFSDLNDKKTADFCAAPGGKTAALIIRGAKVDAYDISEKRMERVKENLDRLELSANLITIDANKIEGEALYDAILIDAPCSATGTIRRHPDLYFHRTPIDVEKLNRAQKKLLKTAHRLLKENGEVVYCTCSLQPSEGEDIIHAVSDLFEIKTIQNPVFKPYLTAEGFIRTFPYENKDGFFMALLKKR